MCVAVLVNFSVATAKFALLSPWAFYKVSRLIHCKTKLAISLQEGVGNYNMFKPLFQDTRRIELSACIYQVCQSCREATALCGHHFLGVLSESVMLS